MIFPPAFWSGYSRFASSKCAGWLKHLAPQCYYFNHKQADALSTFDTVGIIEEFAINGPAAHPSEGQSILWHIWLPVSQHTYCSWPWIRHSSLVGNPLIVRSVSVSIWTQEHSPHVSHAEHAHCWSFEDVARNRNSWYDGWKMTVSTLAINCGTADH